MQSQIFWIPSLLSPVLNSCLHTQQSLIPSLSFTGLTAFLYSQHFLIPTLQFAGLTVSMYSQHPWIPALSFLWLTMSVNYQHSWVSALSPPGPTTSLHSWESGFQHHHFRVQHVSVILALLHPELSFPELNPFLYSQYFWIPSLLIPGFTRLWSPRIPGFKHNHSRYSPSLSAFLAFLCSSIIIPSTHHVSVSIPDIPGFEHYHSQDSPRLCKFLLPVAWWTAQPWWSSGCCTASVLRSGFCAPKADCTAGIWNEHRPYDITWTSIYEVGSRSWWINRSLRMVWRISAGNSWTLEWRIH